MSPRADGGVWSPHLTSWLKADGNYLHLYDPFGNRRLTEKEAEALARQIATDRAERETLARKIEAARAEVAIRQMRAEAARAEQEALARQAEAARAERERQRAEAFAEKLRALGIDPDQPL